MNSPFALGRFLAALAVAHGASGPGSAQPAIPSSPSPAQPAADAQGKAVGDEDIMMLEAFVTTGSNIRRMETEKALPVTVYQREQIEIREASTPVQLLSALPQVINVPLVENQGGSAISAPGDNSSISLRGAGSGNTLVLLNGRRLVPHPLSSIDEGAVPSLSVNVGQLPNRGIQQVDVLRDGASSIYGTDAVAGVVNYVMDREFRGNELAVRFTVPEHGGGFEYRTTLTVGRDFAGGRGRVVSVFDYMDREAIDSRDRDYSLYLSKIDQAPPIWQTPNAGPFFSSSVNQDYLNYNFSLGSVNAAGEFVGSRPSHVSSTIASGVGRFYIIPRNTASGVGFKPSTASRTDQYESAYYTNLANTGYIQNESQRTNWYSYGEFDLKPELTLFGEIGYYEAFSDNPAQGNVQTFSAGNPSVIYSNPPLVVSADNPWNPFGSRFYHPTGAPNADGTPRLTGTPSEVFVHNAAFRGLYSGGQQVTTMVFRSMAGIRGRFSDSWTWEAAALYSRSTSKDRVIGQLRQSVMRDLVANARLNPFGYTFKVENGALLVDQPYTHYAPDFPGLQDTRSRDGETVLSSIDFRTGGNLFPLFGNMTQLAAGAEFRQDEYSNYHHPYSGFNPPESGLPTHSSDFVGSSPAGNADADRQVTSGYVELLVPLSTPRQNRRLMHQLELSASARTEYYSDFGSTTKPKISLNWRPVPSVMLRASYNQGFRAPNLSVLYSGDLPRQRGILDPYRQPVTNGLTIDGSSSRPFTLYANPDLQPEEAIGKTVGLVIDVPKVRGLSFSVDYWEIKQTDVIVSPFDSLPQDDYIALAAATQAQLAAGRTIDQVDLGSGTDAYQGAYGMVRLPVTEEDRAFFAAYNATRAPAEQLGVVGPMSRLFSQYINRAEGFLSGYDFGLNYNLPAKSWGRLSFGTDWAYIKDLYYIVKPGDPVDEVRYDNPRLRGSVNVTWRRGGWSAAFGAYYTGHYLSTTAFLTESQYNAESAATSREYLQGVYDIGSTTYRYIVDDLWTFNASVNYRFRTTENPWLRDLSLRLGVSNLTDETPPLTGSSFSRTVNSNVLSGRTWSFQLAKRF